jgi:glycosyltransferase involved in cell wall biosynthesis
MTISILLPTRNGGDQLETCVRSILDQPDTDLELVVSDNASDAETRDILASFDDPRLKLVRQPEMLSVTDNWSATLNAATGDYVLLIGDDDALLPGSIGRMQALLDEFGNPDVLSFEAYGFAFPTALGEDSPAYCSDPLFPYDERLPKRGILGHKERARSVREFFDFEIKFCPNLQTTLCSRTALQGLRNGAFREPYPDFYAINALLLVADTWAHVPEKLSVVGISPKSFGRTLKGGGTDEGRKYLGIGTEFEGWLPGTDMINGSYRFLKALLEDYRAELPGVEISRSNYVYRQGYAWYLAFRLGEIDRAELLRRLRMLSPGDYVGFVREFARRAGPQMVRNHARVDEQSAIASVWPNMNPIPDVGSLADFIRWVAPEPVRTP